MSRRSQLEHEVSVAQERIKKAAKDTPKDIIKLWKQDLVDLELELNNLVDDEEDNNEDNECSMDIDCIVGKLLSFMGL